MNEQDERLSELIAALHQHSDGSQKDVRLCELIIKACRHPYPSSEWRRAIHRLLLEIQQLPDIAKSSHPDYLDALNRTWEWLRLNIGNFQPRPPSIQVSLVKWVNSYLYWRIRDLYSPDNCAPVSLDAPISFENSAEGTTRLERVTDPSLSGLEALIEEDQQQQRQRLGLEKKLYIELDPEGKLRDSHPKSRPDCNCQLLAQRHLLKDPPDSFADISRDLGVNFQTLVSHWKRKCLPLLRETDS